MSSEYLTQWQVDQARFKAARGLPLSNVEARAVSGDCVDLSSMYCRGAGVIVFNPGDANDNPT